MRIRPRRRTDGTTAWQLDARIGGNRYRLDIPADTRRDAEALAQDWYESARRAAFTGQPIPAPQGRANAPGAPPALTLRDLLAYDRKRADIADATRVMEEFSSRQLLRVLGLRTHVAILTGHDIERYKRQRQEEGRRPRTINIELQCLRGALARAHAQGLLRTPPPSIDLVPEPRRRMRVLTREELLRVLAECARRPGLYEQVAFLANTALRRSELFLLRWRDVDLENAMIHVLTKKTGGGGPARYDPVPLNAVALDVLTSMAARTPARGPDDLVFGISPDRRDTTRRTAKAKGAPGTVNGLLCTIDHRLRHRLKAAAKRAGVEWWSQLRIHDMRHGFATHALSAGAAVHEVAAVLRHRSIKTTLDTYAHETMKGMRSAADAAAASAPRVLAIEEIRSTDGQRDRGAGAST